MSFIFSVSMRYAREEKKKKGEIIPSDRYFSTNNSQNDTRFKMIFARDFRISCSPKSSHLINICCLKVFRLHSISFRPQNSYSLTMNNQATYSDVNLYIFFFMFFDSLNTSVVHREWTDLWTKKCIWCDFGSYFFFYRS